MSSKKNEALKRNQEKRLECTECCVAYRLDKEGKWRCGGKVADLVAGKMLQCTCGTPVGVLIQEGERLPIHGEVIAVN